MVGSGLFRYLSQKGHVVVPAYNGQKIDSGVQLNITDAQQVSLTVAKIKPDWIIHCAAMTDVDECERDFEKAMKINADATGTIASTAKKNGVKLAYLSTSFVFGNSKNALLEDALAQPVNNYGKSKLAGERRVAESGVEYIVVRIDQPYGWVKLGQKENMVTGTLRKLKEGKPFNVVDDWCNSPTYLSNFYGLLEALIKKDAFGIFNCTGKTHLSRFEWAQKIATEFDMDVKLIRKMNSSTLNLPAKRPDVVLDVGKIENATGIKIFSVEAGLNQMKKSEQFSWESIAKQYLGLYEKSIYPTENKKQKVLVKN